MNTYNQSIIFGIDSDTRNKSYQQARDIMALCDENPSEIDPLELVKLVTLMSTYNPFHSIIFDLINNVELARPDILENEHINDMLFAAMTGIKQDITITNKKLYEKLLCYNFIHHSDNIEFQLPEDFPIYYEYDICNHNWFIQMISTHKRQLYKNSYSPEVIQKIFNKIRTLKCFDFRKGINSYASFILFFGVNNIGDLLGTPEFKRSVLTLDKKGSVYNDIISVIGKDEFDYLETICKLA